MNKAPCQPSPPVFENRMGRTLLSYPDLDRPSIVHGIAVFKDAGPGLDYCEWGRLASGYLLSSLTPEPSRIVIPRQIHSSDVIDADRAEEDAAEGDAVVTGSSSTAMGISVSDCIPLFAVNPDSGVAGLAHCGWRGIAGGIVERFVSELEAKGSPPAQTTFLLGASIGPCCYQVGQDLLDCFQSGEAQEFSRRAGQGVVFDLKAVVASRLIAAGARAGRISIDKTCTSCQKYVLSSYRADGRGCGRMLAFLMLTGQD